MPGNVLQCARPMLIKFTCPCGHQVMAQSALATMEGLLAHCLRAGCKMLFVAETP